MARNAARTFSIKRQPGFATIAMLCFFILYLPIATLVVYAFNEGTSIATWEGLSLRWFASAWQNQQVIDASIVESVFAVPGLGRLLVDAVLWRDYPMIQGAMLFVAALFILVNAATDLLYAAVDPRIRVAK